LPILPAIQALPHGFSAERVERTCSIGSTSANSNTVQTLDENADQAAIIAKINELNQALRR